MPKSPDHSFFGEKRPAGEVPPIEEKALDEILEQARFHVPKENLMRPEKEEGTEEQREEDVFDKAQSIEELRKMLVERGGVTTSSGEHMTADEVFVAILSGNLGAVTRNHGLRRKARELLMREEFRFASNMDDVYAELRRRGSIVGDDRVYTAEEIIDLIGQRKIDEIPKTDGLRFTVNAMLKNEPDQMLSGHQESSERISVDVVDGDVIVSKSGVRRKVTEIVLYPGFDGGGKIVFTIEQGGQKKFGSMTFAEYDAAKRRGIIDRIERKNP